MILNLGNVFHCLIYHIYSFRLLWEAEINRSKMLQEQVVQTVSSLLSTEVDELLQAVLKALAIFTHRCNEQCALQVWMFETTLTAAEGLSLFQFFFFTC